MRRKLLFFLCPFVLWTSLRAEDPALLNTGIGVFNILHGPKTAIFQLEYRSNYEIYRSGPLWVRPLVGVMATATGSSYYYGGLAFDLFFTKHLAITPSFAPGIYMQGGGKDLGFPLEFRSSMELSYRFNNKARFGAMFYHISNASLGHRNPGTECLVFFYSIPINSPSK